MNELTPEQWKELYAWINGESMDVPEFMRSQSKGMAEKVAFSMNSILNTSIIRIMRLQEFINKAEGELYSDESLLKLEPEAVNMLYKNANKTLAELSEFVRKYTAQGKDLMDVNDVQTDHLKNVILSLPKEKIDAVLEIVNSL